MLAKNKNGVYIIFPVQKLFISASPENTGKKTGI
jgi:hypothetical protein